MVGLRPARGTSSLHWVDILWYGMAFYLFRCTRHSVSLPAFCFVLFCFALLFTLTVFLLGHMCRQPPMPSQARKPSFLKKGLRESFPGEQPWALGREVAELWDGFPSMADLLAVHSAAWLSSWACEITYYFQFDFKLFPSLFSVPEFGSRKKEFGAPFLWSSNICAVKPYSS